MEAIQNQKKVKINIKKWKQNVNISQKGRKNLIIIDLNISKKKFLCVTKAYNLKPVFEKIMNIFGRFSDYILLWYIRKIKIFFIFSCTIIVILIFCIIIRNICQNFYLNAFFGLQSKFISREGWLNKFESSIKLKKDWN